jgi:hypothetical protein
MVRDKKSALRKMLQFVWKNKEQTGMSALAFKKTGGLFPARLFRLI